MDWIHKDKDYQSACLIAELALDDLQWNVLTMLMIEHGTQLGPLDEPLIGLLARRYEYAPQAERWTIPHGNRSYQIEGDLIGFQKGEIHFQLKRIVELSSHCADTLHGYEDIIRSFGFYFSPKITPHPYGSYRDLYKQTRPGQ